MMIEVDADRLASFIDAYIVCTGCPAKNEDCAYHKGALATKGCVTSTIAWLMKYAEEMAHAPAVVHRHPDGTMG